MYKEGGWRYKQIVKIGCQFHYNHEGEYISDCGYDWECEECPCWIEHNRHKWEEDQNELKD